MLAGSIQATNMAGLPVGLVGWCMCITCSGMFDGKLSFVGSVNVRPACAFAARLTVVISVPFAAVLPLAWCTHILRLPGVTLTMLPNRLVLSMKSAVVSAIGLTMCKLLV